jgi:hypothetical protein
MKQYYQDTTRQTGVFGRLTVRAYAEDGKFSKTLALFEKSTFLPVLGRFCMGVSQFLYRSFWPALHTPRQFSPKVQGTELIICFLDSWLHGASAGQ